MIRIVRYPVLALAVLALCAAALPTKPPGGLDPSTLVATAPEVSLATIAAQAAAAAPQTALSSEIHRAQQAEAAAQSTASAAVQADGGDASGTKVTATGATTPRSMAALSADELTAASLAAGAMQAVDPRVSNALPAFLGEVAAGPKMADGYNGSTYSQACGGTVLVMRATTPSIQILYANTYLAAGGGEQALPGTTTFKGALLYKGQLTPLTFSGATTISSTTKNLLYSDPIPAPPNGARFTVFTLISNPTGGVPFDYLPEASYGPGALATVGTAANVPDCTASGAVAAPAAGVGVFPVAVIGMTTSASVSLFGDSRFSGVADNRSDGTTDAGEAARFVGAGLPYINMSDPGDTLVGTQTSMALRKILFGFTTEMLDEYGVNDIYSGTSAASVSTQRSLIAAMFNGPVYGFTLAPETTSTDNWTTTTGQAVFAAYEPQRVAFNALERGGISGETGTIDIDAALDPTGSGLWPPKDTPDGVHENTPASLLEKRSGVAWNGISLNRH